MVFRSGNKGKRNAFCTALIFGVRVNCVTTTTRCFVVNWTIVAMRGGRRSIIEDRGGGHIIKYSYSTVRPTILALCKIHALRVLN